MTSLACALAFGALTVITAGMPLGIWYRLPERWISGRHETLLRLPDPRTNRKHR
ncbi:hypothetical protein AB0A77_28465 [Streptomyces varsoviensis]|uniref:hypothetical protein n=1 Tax=Streptomyces varsoviensis TaxID=67373 RepID=UPI0033F53B30